MMKEIATIITAFSFLLLTACSADKPDKTLRSAYYWSTTWQMDSSKSDSLEAIKSINRQNRDINNDVILFDLNTDNIKRFNSEDYEKIYRH